MLDVSFNAKRRAPLRRSHPRPSQNRKASLVPRSLLSILLISTHLAKSAKTCLPLRRERAPFPFLPVTYAAATTITATVFPRGGCTANLGSTPTFAASNPLAAKLSSFVRTVVNSRSHLAAAAAARCVSIFGMYPVDTVKTRLQMKQEGAFRLSGLYKGVMGSLIGQVPYGVLTFGSYEIYKQSLLSRFPDVKPAFIYALAAIMGDVTGSGWLCPSEVTKQQLQAGIYPSMSQAISGIWKKNGIRGFYQGFTGGLARDVPFRVAQLTTFEVTKNLYLRAKRSKDPDGAALPAAVSPFEAAICGAAAGSFSAAITTPLDVIKTLMMTDTANAHGGSVVACARKIVKDDGLSGLMAGMIPRVALIAPSVCIFFVTYEIVQQKMNKRV